MTGKIIGPFTGLGLTAVPVTPPDGNPRVRETRITITDDQASRLRAMVEAMQGRRHRPPGVGPEPGLPTSVVGNRCPSPPASPPRRTAKVVTLASGKGGVGKTNASVNLAIALAQLGRRTTLLDADLGMANADVLCGLTPTRRLEQFVGISDQPAGGVAQTRSAWELAIDAPGGFKLIPGSVGVSRMTELSASERDRLLAALAELDQSSDLIIVDTGAGLGREVVSFSRAADLSLVIANPEPTSIADAYALIKCILRPATQRARDLRPSTPIGGGHEGPNVSLILNQVSGRPEAEAVHARIAAVCHRFLSYRLPLLGWIPQDPAVALSVRRRRPLLLGAPAAPAAVQLRSIAAAIAAELKIHSPAGAPAHVCNGSAGLSGFLSRVLRGR